MKRSILLISGCLTVGCAGDARIPATERPVRDSAGIAIWEADGQDRPYATPRFVGDLLSPDSALTPVPWAIATDPGAGRVYVADQGTPRVVIFGAEGAYLGSLGREGDGPGEFRSPNALALDSVGTLTVWDPLRGILSSWSRSGELLNERRPPVGYWGPGFALDEDRLVTVTTSEAAERRDQHLVLSGRGVVDTLLTVPQTLVPVELPCGSIPAARLFAPSIVWTGRPRLLHVLNGPEYVIDVFADGRHVRSVRRDIEPIEVTDQSSIERVATGQYAGFLARCGVSAEAFASALGHERVTAPVQAMATDPAGRLWVARSDDGVRPNVIDVFDPEGGYVGTATTPAVPAAFLSPTRFVALRILDGGEVVASLYDSTPPSS